ncbi:unnamed protein product [Ilex paraguariensis]|uniref:Late embryogenesis abundant protein LEA-2 subgroup domain-containing protein n=1 Tax=Ilex paraguariensis TaxID=185542 RepID=A0ABC8UG23_9AQUA
MTDRVYPSAKPAANGTTTAAAAVSNKANGGAPTFPATKAQLYNTTRPLYRPQPPPRRRSGRSCCCRCCLWTTFTILLIILLAAIAGAVVWVLYRPHRPSFSVSSFQVSQFNITSSSQDSQLNSKFNLTVSARNPNGKIIFLYDPITVSITSDGVDIGDGSFPGFVHGKKNTTTLRTVITSAGQSLDSTAVNSLKNKKSLPLKIKLDTKVKVKIGSLKTTKVGIRVSCDGIKTALPTGKSATTATTSDAKCKVDLRIKIWKWTV